MATSALSTKITGRAMELPIHGRGVVGSANALRPGANPMTNWSITAADSKLPTEGGGVLRGRDIVCFSHDWTGDPLSKTHFMRLLARNNRVLWVNSIGYRAPTASKADLRRALNKLAAATHPMREVEPNLFVLSPLAVPAYGMGTIRAINRGLLTWQVRRAMKRLGFRRAINWVFNPAAALLAGRLSEEQIVYHCVDEYTAFSGVAGGALAALEQELLHKANAVIVSSERLYGSKKSDRAPTVLVRHGVDYEHFRRALDPETCVPDEIASLPRPIVGYFGLMAHDWFDLDLMVRVVERMPAVSFVFLGKVTMDLSRLQRLPNVLLAGRKPYQLLPAYCKGFDVGVIPFPINEVTLNANPLKMREYLAAGLPVVSTRIPEVEAVGQCRIADDAAGFERAVCEALSDSGSAVERSRAMQCESWAARLEEIESHLSQVLV
jgi:glycosyltransferase involved in cell wall biosynthesis